ncbi:MAG: porin [Cytophagaceae bacterium]
MKNQIFAVITLLVIIQISTFAQDTTNTAPVQKPTEIIPQPPKETVKKKWYESISMRGYTQVRYNRLLETNPKLKCDQCDRSIGEGGGFFIRRIRLIFFGNVHERVYMYIQPDLASSVSSGSLHWSQIRDAYFDLSLDKKKEFRLRIGQSKVPYGFENMQSSQNRIPLDRNDALNSAVANERDLGVFFYWAPAKIRERFSWLVSSGLKGSGDYGVFGIGLYNGQTANRPEANQNSHVVTRLSYPFKIGNQIIEPGVQAYQGMYNVKDVRSAGVKSEDNIIDRRVAGSLMIYPQPFGFMAEYTIGEGPEYSPQTNSIDAKNLWGGYAMIMYNIKISDSHVIIPFIRTQHYHGGKKHEMDARKYRVHEHEFGIEWQPIPNFEFVAMYTISDRVFEDSKNPVNQQKGNLLRLQAQFNY